MGRFFLISFASFLFVGMTYGWQASVLIIALGFAVYYVPRVGIVIGMIAFLAFMIGSLHNATGEYHIDNRARDVRMHVAYNPEECSEQMPIKVTIANRSQGVVRHVYFHVRGIADGSWVYGNTEFAPIIFHEELQPGDMGSICVRIPPRYSNNVLTNLTPDLIKWNIIRKTRKVVFA